MKKTPFTASMKEQSTNNKLIIIAGLVVLVLILALLLKQPITSLVNPSAQDDSSSDIEGTQSRTVTEYITELKEGKPSTFTPKIEVLGDVIYEDYSTTTLPETGETTIDDIWVNTTGDTMTGNLSITKDGTLVLPRIESLIFNSSTLGDTNSASDSGAFLIGAFDEFTNSDNTNVQAILDDLDKAISDLESSIPSITESDPIFSASPAASITNTYISHWNAAYSWGDHALIGYLTSESDPVWTAAEPSYFNRTQNETVTGIPSFNGGLSGSTAPFTVDSTYMISNLNADLLDGYHAADFMGGGIDLWIDETGDTMLGDLILSGADINIGTNNLITGSNSLSSSELDILDSGINFSELSGTLGDTQISVGAVDLDTTEVAGILPIANGGTNASSYTTNEFLWYNGTRIVSSGYDQNDFMPAVTDNWVDEAGDTMTGTLIFSGVATDITTAGGEAITISAPGAGHIILDAGTGNVGIGTTNPLATLDLQGDGIIRGDLVIRETTPDTEAWDSISTINAPLARDSHSAVWTGSEMIIWGGRYSSGAYNTGGIYDPETDSWTATTTTAAPTARQVHASIWSGSKMIILGGLSGGGSCLSSGGIYDPGTDSWTATSTTGAPTDISDKTTIWTGNKFIVWGGVCSDLNTGSIYDPILDTWTSISTSGAPTARSGHTVVWTGKKMIVWGGISGINYLNSGGMYDPETDTWTTITTTGAPSARAVPELVWTGDKVIVFDGFNYNFNPSSPSWGGIYDPETNSWLSVSFGSGRESGAVVWTGNRMTRWGGMTATPATVSGTGVIYDIETNSLVSMLDVGDPSARYAHTAIWTGNQIIIWGGNTSYGYLNDGGIYTSPTEKGGKLYVQGEATIDDNLFVSKTITAGGIHSEGGADIAEYYPTIDPSIEAGDVVSISDNTQIEKSNTLYGSKLIGVVSTNPGVTLSSKETNPSSKEYRLVALAGRVPVKFTTENGTVKGGDYLVSSSTPGTAMSACGPKYCMSGMSIGTALEDVNSDGLVLLFVNLTWYQPESTRLKLEKIIAEYEDGNLDIIDNLTVTQKLSADVASFKSVTINDLVVDNRLKVAGLLTASNIRTGIIESINTSDIIVRLSDHLGSTAFRIEDENEKMIFQIDSAGKIQLKEDPQSPSIGEGTITSGNDQVRIRTKSVGDNSRIFITPTVTTDKQLSVTEKASDDYFLVTISSPVDYDITFDWWIIN
ncbi:MAG: hypothetical protein PHS44_00150 [Candidatus Dojkabacteria bacterium]|nr:hypothetical protein [Candidatus Dojkabacteria bacterium]